MGLEVALTGVDPFAKATEETLGQEQWNKLLWGPQLELDKAEAASFAQAKTQAGLSGKGAQLGKEKTLVE